MKYAEVRTGRGGKSTRPGDDIGPTARRSRRSAESELENSREVEKKGRGQTALPLTSCGLKEAFQALPVVHSENLLDEGRQLDRLDAEDRCRPLVIDLYCGHGGVGLALDELNVDYIGVDIEDRSDTYPGEFVQADASVPPLDVDANLVWASTPCTPYSDLSPTYYGSREAAMEACPTIPELNVREIADSLGAEYIIENVPGASRVGHLRDPTRLNGLAFGKPYDLERHFETSFPVPDALESGELSVKVQTREGDDQSVADLADAKGVPASWGSRASGQQFRQSTSTGSCRIVRQSMHRGQCGNSGRYPRLPAEETANQWPRR